MDESDGRSDVRLIAACERCGSVYAATKVSSGEIQPIGSRDGCSCGSSAFTELDDAETFDSALAEESVDDS